MGHLELFHIAVFACVMLCWFVFAVAFLARKRAPAGTATARRDRGYLPGIILQGAGFAAVWNFRRQLFTHIVEVPYAVEVCLAVLTVAVAVLSAWFALTAIRALGRHWSIDARTLENHDLITAGPYAVVRHPIYTALYGLLLSTGMALSTWQGLALAAVLYAAGTYFRIASEERLLRETFGARYLEYAARVPAFLPFVR